MCSETASTDESLCVKFMADMARKGLTWETLLSVASSWSGIESRMGGRGGG